MSSSYLSIREALEPGVDRDKLRAMVAFHIGQAHESSGTACVALAIMYLADTLWDVRGNA
jgi:hypothetical protein